MLAVLSKDAVTIRLRSSLKAADHKAHGQVAHDSGCLAVRDVLDARHAVLRRGDAAQPSGLKARNIRDPNDRAHRRLACGRGVQEASAHDFAAEVGAFGSVDCGGHASQPGRSTGLVAAGICKIAAR